MRKMLFTIIFSFSHNIFRSLRFPLHNRLRDLSLPFPIQALVFTCLQFKSFENFVGKGEIAHNEQVLLFPQCFPSGELSAIFVKIKDCCLHTLSVWKPPFTRAIFIDRSKFCEQFLKRVTQGTFL